MNKFLFTSDNLVKFHQSGKHIYIIALSLNVKEIAYIKDNFEKFKNISQNILFTINSNSLNYYSNITF